MGNSKSTTAASDLLSFEMPDLAGQHNIQQFDSDLTNYM